MVVLTAYATLKPECVEAAIAACRTVRGHSVLEPGCERYDFYQSPDDRTKIVFVEEWTCKPDLDTHFEQTAFHEFIAVMGDYLASPPEMRIFESSLVG